MMRISWLGDDQLVYKNQNKRKPRITFKLIKGTEEFSCSDRCPYSKECTEGSDELCRLCQGMPSNEQVSEFCDEHGLGYSELIIEKLR